MGQVNPLSYAFHIKKGDLYPPIRIKLYNESSDEDFDLSGYVGKFYLASVDDSETLKVDAGTVVISDAGAGEAYYQWVSGDTDTSGQYYYEFRFTKDLKQFTVPVISPGVIYIEENIGS